VCVCVCIIRICSIRLYNCCARVCVYGGRGEVEEVEIRGVEGGKRREVRERRIYIYVYNNKSLPGEGSGKSRSRQVVFAASGTPR
jgi:hypothetical protein